VSRELMQDVAEDVFSLAAAEGWSDPVAGRALHFIERRQRNRAAAEHSPHGGLEGAVADAARHGLNAERAAEISTLAGISSRAGARILADEGGEPIAILCKATGLGREDLRNLWRALRRAEVGPDGEAEAAWERVRVTYEMLAVDRAQTVMRYWNWALSRAERG
jgi:uncharacterized protein (DUF2336 family)